LDGFEKERLFQNAMNRIINKWSRQCCRHPGRRLSIPPLTAARFLGAFHVRAYPVGAAIGPGFFPVPIQNTFSGPSQTSTSRYPLSAKSLSTSSGSLDQVPVPKEAHSGGQAVAAHVGHQDQAARSKPFADLREDRHGGRGIKVIQEPRKHDILAGRENPLVF